MVRSARAQADLEAAMLQAPVFRGVPRRAVRDLVDAGTVRHYRRNTYLFHQDDPAPEVFFLWTGRVEISSLSGSGHRQLYTTLEEPQFFGELGVLGEMRRTASAVALEDTTVLALSADSFLGFLDRHFEASRNLLRALSRQIQAVDAFAEDLLYLDLKGRVAKRLLGLVAESLNQLPEDGTMLPSVVTHADLASLAGGSRENVTRILSELQRRGIVERSGRRYVLMDVKALARMAGL